MADQPKNESVQEETEPQKERDIVSPSASSFFASAWSAWGKVISKLVLGGNYYNIFHYIYINVKMIKTIRNPFGRRLRIWQKLLRIRLPILLALRKRMNQNKKS